ncbi:Glutamine-rich protein 2 [Mactra antiquata]
MPAAVSLAQMVDLSLGTPEIGSVNFNVMHTLLHAIIKKLNISDSRAEINEHDRDFLATSKIRARSTLSDADSGRGEDSEDGVSEKSGVPPFRPTPYHRLELKVEKLNQQMEELNKLPSNSDLFDRTTKSKGEPSERPVADMWQYMQLKKRVDANEEGVGKLFSLIEDMMKEMKELKDANKSLQERIKGLNVDDLKKRLAELENVTKELNEKFALLPTPEEISQFVTWPALEDALKGIRDDLTPQERVVIEMSSQTEPKTRAKPKSYRIRPSRPGSSRPVSRVSTPGPSEQLLDILERLGKLDSDHVTLKKRVDDLEEEMKNKLDKSALEGLGVPTELLEQVGKLKEELDALAAAREKDSDALTRAQQAILQLQAEVEKLHHTTSDIIEENKTRTSQIQDILKYCDKLQEEKADKDYVQMEVDVKADKKALDNKVNHKLFDKTTEEINNMIKEILDKLTGHDEDWKNAYSKLTEELDGKLDRLELDPLKEWLEARLKALNDKLKKYQTRVDFSEDDAAGIRKQLIQKFHCISCDRPVDMLPTGLSKGPVPSLPSQQGLIPTKSPRPYTTFELDQIRQHAKRIYHGADQSPKSRFVNPEVTDYYATPRPCGGSHTLTYPHKRNTKLTHLSHLFREDEAIIIPATKEEIDIQGADGHIYRGRNEGRNVQKLEARFPSTLGQNNNNAMGMNVRSTSPQPQLRPKPPQSQMVTQQRNRPMSARTPPSPRPSSSGQRQESRPVSAKVRQRDDSEMAPPTELAEALFSPEQRDEAPATEQSIQLEMPSADVASN